MDTCPNSYAAQQQQKKRIKTTKITTITHAPNILLPHILRYYALPLSTQREKRFSNKSLEHLDKYSSFGKPINFGSIPMDAKKIYRRNKNKDFVFDFHFN